MKVIGLVGWSGAGKTTLLAGILPLIVAQGVRASTMKHAHHGFDMDVPGKDSYRHRAAGATEVLVASPERWVLMHEARGEPEPDVAALIARMTEVDLLLIEGFKSHPHPKIEVHRPALGKPLIWQAGSDIIGVASDAALPAVSVPVLDLNDHVAAATFVLHLAGLG